MFWKLLSLEWKAFTRSTAFKFKIWLKIFVGIGVLFYGALILFLGVAAFYGLQEEHLEPLSTINKYLIFWWSLDLVFRYFVQKLPTMWLRPLLTQNVSKNKLTHYLMFKSISSFFNIYPFLFTIPFGITLLANGYSIIGVIDWFLGITALILINNFINLMIRDKWQIFAVIATIYAVLGGGFYFGKIDLLGISSDIFHSLYLLPWLAVPILAVAYGLYRYNFTVYRKELYLDKIDEAKGDENTTDFSWLNRFGLMGVFMKNDLKLLLRNKSAKKVLWTAFFFLFYGLYFFLNDKFKDSETAILFVGVLVTGGFSMSFGMYVPAWDSSYYPLMMSQNIKYREYLASKWWLMTISTVLLLLLSTLYLYFGWKYYEAFIVGALYNIGINNQLTLLTGAYVKTPIDLNVSRKMTNQGNFNFRMILMGLAKIAGPLVIYYGFKLYFNEQIGIYAVGIVGILGLLFRNLLFREIGKIYIDEKYDTLYAFKQKN